MCQLFKSERIFSLIIVITMALFIITLALFMLYATSPLCMADTLSDHYVAPDLSDVNPQIPGYDLPLSESSINNFNTIKNRFQITDGAKALIRSNGFVVGDWTQEEDLVEIYKDLKDWNIPIFITSDTLLHLYHIQFDETLMRIEEDEFYYDMRSLSEAFFDHFLVLSNSYIGDLAEAAGRNAAFFALGLALLESSLPSGLDPQMEAKVNEELALIQAHAGFADSPLFTYKEDYSQYVPRGHYTRSETLKKYFKAMMWYGRMAFLIKGDPLHCPLDYCPALVSTQESRLQTLQAVLIAADLSQVSTGGRTLQQIWDRIYSVTAFYVGIADDLTPYEYLDALQTLFNGEDIDLEVLASDEDLFFALKSELALMRSPEIFGGTGNAGIFIGPGETLTPEQLEEILEKTKGMRLMGQRFVPDSYMFGQLVAPNVDLLTGDPCFTSIYIDGYGWVRGFPRGLDIMDILGSQRARAILKAEGDASYIDYEEQRQKMIDLLEALSAEDWQRNLYWGWLYCLRPLFTEYGDGYQGFMKTGAWQDKQLNAALASWTELRHDTILYAKQSYTPIMVTSVQVPPPPVVGYVEPVPEFYARLLALTRMTRLGLDALSVLDTQGRSRLLNLESLLDRILEISVKELENQPLTNDDYEFINDFGEQLEGAVLGVSDRGTSTVLVADVHTDSNTEKVLEEGVGFADLILAAYRVPDGRILMGVGPVFTYYEFKHPMNDRLTDEAWKEMLQGPEKPDPPAWIYSYSLGEGLADLRDQAPDLPEPVVPVEEPPVVSPPVTPWRPNPFLPITGSLYPVFPWSGWSTPGMNLNPYAISNPLGTYTFQQPSVYNLFQVPQLSHSTSFSPYQWNITNINMPTVLPFQGYYSGYTPLSLGGWTGGMTQGIMAGYSGYLQYQNLSTYFWNR